MKPFPVEQIASWITCTLVMLTLYPSQGTRASPDLLQMQYAYTNAPSREELEFPMSHRPRGGGGGASECWTSVRCKNSRRMPVCGTDGITYTSKCELKKLRKCEGRQVSIHSMGRCPTMRGVKSKTCTRPDRMKFNQHLVAIFSDEYDRDPATKNSNKAISHETRVVSWKFDQLDEDSDGLLRRGDIRVLKKLLKKVVKPRKCAKSFDVYCDLDQDRRISRREWSACLGADVTELDKPRKQGSGKICSLFERANFNQQLIDAFSEEFEKRTVETSTVQNSSPAQSRPETILDTPERRVIKWKFSELDVDHDGRLRRDEIRPLKNHVKENYKPKSCAKSLDSNCDLNNDQFITPNEWSVCLGIDSNNGQNKNTGLTGTTGGGGRPGNSGTNRKQGNNNGGTSGRVPQAKQSLLNIISRLKQTPDVNQSTEPPLNDGQGRTTEQPSVMLEGGCLEARANSLDLHRKDPDAHIFVPECLADGQFRKEQCHNGTRLCWCVDQKTGKPIPATTTSWDVMPNCTNLKRREFKGCSYSQRRSFLTKLLDQLTAEMAVAANNATHGSPMPDPSLSLEERAVRWKLRLLDKNNNSEMEKEELNSFKKEIKMKKDLRKCSRNFLRYCDENNDTSITMDEWIDCTGIHEKHRKVPLHIEPGRINPLAKYLKGGQ